MLKHSISIFFLLIAGIYSQANAQSCVYNKNTYQMSLLVYPEYYNQDNSVKDLYFELLKSGLVSNKIPLSERPSGSDNGKFQLTEALVLKEKDQSFLILKVVYFYKETQIVTTHTFAEKNNQFTFLKGTDLIDPGVNEISMFFYYYDAQTILRLVAPGKENDENFAIFKKHCTENGAIDIHKAVNMQGPGTELFRTIFGRKI